MGWRKLEEKTKQTNVTAGVAGRLKIPMNTS